MNLSDVLQPYPLVVCSYMYNSVVQALWASGAINTLCFTVEVLMFHVYFFMCKISLICSCLYAYKRCLVIDFFFNSSIA